MSLMNDQIKDLRARLQKATDDRMELLESVEMLLATPCPEIVYKWLEVRGLTDKLRAARDKANSQIPQAMNTPSYLLNVYLGDTPMGALMTELSNHGLVPMQTRTHNNVVVMQFDERPSLLAVASIHENLKATIGYFEAPVNKGFWLFASSMTPALMMPDGTFTQINKH